MFRSQHQGETGCKSTEQRVPILWTACHFGGRRPWYRCAVYSNGQYRGRRVAVLYGAGDLFACRHCYGRNRPLNRPGDARLSGTEPVGLPAAAITAPTVSTALRISERSDSGTAPDVIKHQRPQFMSWLFDHTRKW